MSNSSIFVGGLSAGRVFQSLDVPAKKLNAKASVSSFSQVLESSHKAVPVSAGKILEEKLTGMLLGSAVQLMLPKNSGGLFDQGSSSEMWNSYLANAFADAMSVSGRFDLRLDRD